MNLQMSAALAYYYDLLVEALVEASNVAEATQRFLSTLSAAYTGCTVGQARTWLAQAYFDADATVADAVATSAGIAY